MSWRGVYISEPARLHLKQGRLNIRLKSAETGDNGEEEEHSLPLEDMAFLVLDTQQASVSAALLGACAENGCLVLVCDQKHTPCGALLPFNQHYRQTETVQAQLKLSQPRQKRLWQELICYKIRNQAKCLALLGCPEKTVLKVACLEQKVRSGDPDNIEARAARVYWGAYAGNFIRKVDGTDRLNAMLNYGYALLRATVARELAALGFITCLGLHHCSMRNAFNLADDILEPWRPFVDHLVMKTFKSMPGTEFCLNDRRLICAVLHQNILFEDGEQQILSAIRRQAAMLKAWTLDKRVNLEFPGFALRQGNAACQQTE